MKQLSVSLAKDHLERLTKTSPMAGLAELVWNALDADATRIDIEVLKNELGGVTGLLVRDNGHGFSVEEAAAEFSQLGNSWKAQSATTRGGVRAVHGKQGEGRFKAFALGSAIRWTSVTKASDGTATRVVVSSSETSIQDFTISDPEDVDAPTGTTVEATITPKVAEALSDVAQEFLSSQFALYLEKYPDIRITYDGSTLDTSSTIEHSVEVDLTEDGYPGAILKILEWKPKYKRSLVLCDENGFALQEIKPGIQAKGFQFTAYILSSALRQAKESGELEAWELSEPLRGLVEAARERMRGHFGERRDQKSAEIVQQWRTDQVYPYLEAARNPVEEVEREVFDYVATTINERISDFSGSSKESKKLSLSLIRQAIEQNPGSLNKILQEVLGLPPEQQDEFAELLERASLGAIIRASKKIADRLEFLLGLEHLVFDPQNKKELLERSQLHKIIEEETWVFGEEFNLTVSDKSINDVLRKYTKQFLGREDLAQEPVEVPEQKEAIVDLQFWRVASDQHAHREFLIVELKRPSKKLGSDEITQIKKYAYAVARDERFKDTKTAWSFWLVGNDLNDFAEEEIEQADREHGLIVDKPGIRVWVKTWSQVLDAARRRMDFYQKELNYSPDLAEARTYLKSKYSDVLPASLSEDLDEDTDEDTGV